MTDGPVLQDPSPLADIVLRCDRLEDLAAIRRPEVALVSWPRHLPDGLAVWLDGITPDALPDLRLLVAPAELAKALPPLLERQGLRPSPHRAALVADIGRLAIFFAALTGEPVVDVRLERVRDNACSKFHRDCVRARLLTTYRGPGTQWVRPEHGEAALRASPFTGPIEQLPAHAVAIFKGSCADAGRGIVHRSPPIAGTGIDRLLLCLN